MKPPPQFKTLIIANTQTLSKSRYIRNYQR